MLLQRANKHNLLFPVPQPEKELNTKMDQNDGY
ncbi:RagB/SusD family nutrient uptake outer membrane protein [Chitinophaga sp. S165]|nr:RagB/SusD family nutrient uptake outer membrane protein [Chitinophaga sp. S165]